MSINLKPYFDAAQTASDEVQRIMDEMDAAFSDGTPEGKTKALELRPILDAAKVKAADANQLYISMRDASGVSLSMARHFVPADPDAPVPGSEPKSMERAEFVKLDVDAQMKFMVDGGRVV